MLKSNILATPFNSHDIYPCPVCHLGKISHMPLMEAMSCDFCQQIFTVNLEKQQITMPTRQPPLIWRWNGKKWAEARLEGVELSWFYWVLAAAFVFIPTSLIGVVAYSFHPSPGTRLFWLPYLWTALTFLSHLSIMVWLFLEIYRFPVTAYLRAMRQHLPR